ncbi:hypothetical protein FOA52_002206 [Chlamydomonas sp. UWO 241]|nr:hypothetical protein FOA52_002206 [Chlamydomonas sp. UWO 241]
MQAVPTPRPRSAPPQQRQTAPRATGTSGPNGDGDEDAPGPASDAPPVSGPTFMQGVNWYCYVICGLLFVTDFTPLGQLVRMSSGVGGGAATAALWLAALQWGGVVVPSLSWVRDRGWDVGETLRLCGCSPLSVVSAAAAGAGLWALISFALAAKSGVSLSDVLGSPLDSSVLGSLVRTPDGAAGWATLLGAAALSPAVAEELLFRGLLLTALRERLGGVDAALVCGAMFAASHLDPQQAQAQQIASLVDVVSLLVSRVPGAPMQMPHAEPARARAGHAAHSAAPRAAPAAEAAQPARPAAAAAPVASAGGGPATERPASGATRAASARGPFRRGGLPARVGDTSLRHSFVLSIPVARGANWFLAGGGRRMDEEEATAAERIAAAAEDGTSLPVRLATDVVRFLYGGTGRREPADGGVVSASLLNAKPAVGGIGVEPRGGGVLRVLFTVASDAVADTVVRWRHELRRCVDSTAVFDVLSDREEAQHQALWPAFLAAKFFALTVLGSAAAGFVIATGSVLPAVALHFGFNAAALSAGVLLAVPR